MNLIADRPMATPRETILTAKPPGKPVCLFGQPVYFGETPARIINGSTAP